MPMTCASSTHKAMRQATLYAYLRDSFDVLYAEGAFAPKMMSVGLHCRLAGRPGRFAALARFVDYIGKTASGSQHGLISQCIGIASTKPSLRRRRSSHERRAHFA